MFYMCTVFVDIFELLASQELLQLFDAHDQ